MPGGARAHATLCAAPVPRPNLPGLCLAQLEKGGKPIPPGTRICVLGADGFGLGRVTSVVAGSSAANENTVQFDRGLTKQLDLKRARWTVKPGDMEQLRAEQEAAEAERAVKRCFQEATGAPWPGGMEQREAGHNLQEWTQLRLGADGEACIGEQLKQAIRRTDGVMEAAAGQVCFFAAELRALTFLLTDSLDCTAREGGQVTAARHADLRARRGLRLRHLRRVPRRRSAKRLHDRV